MVLSARLCYLDKHNRKESLTMKMDLNLILTILGFVCTVVAVVISYYQTIKKKIEQEALDAINKAEDTDKIGEEKLADAVETVYAMLPLVARPFISKLLIETIIQSAFDKVEEYAQKQVAKEQEATSQDDAN